MFKEIPKEGLILLSREEPFCSSCEFIENILKNMKVKYVKLDVVSDLNVARMSVPVLIKDNREILNGKIPDVERIKNIITGN